MCCEDMQLSIKVFSVCNFYIFKLSFSEVNNQIQAMKTRLKAMINRYC